MVMRYEVVARVFWRALAKGGTRLGATTAEWDISGNCQSPVTRELVGRRETVHLRQHEVAASADDPQTWESVSVIIHCKCRKCETCLRQRSYQWRQRAASEMRLAPRTWFGTLTYKPEEHYRRQIEVERAAVRKGLDWSGLAPDEKSALFYARAGKDVTLFLKRVRKVATGPLRFLLVSEAHKSGLPHWHLLVHECSLGAVKHAQLSAAWSQGFSKWKLAPVGDLKAAGYLTKYISKSLQARVRASKDYGKDWSAYAIASEGLAREFVTGNTKPSVEKLRPQF